MNEQHELHGDDLDAMAEADEAAYIERLAAQVPTRLQPEPCVCGCGKLYIDTNCEIEAERYNDAVVFNGGIHPANWHDEPDPNEATDEQLRY